MSDEQHTERLQMRVPPEFIRKVDDWRRLQDEIPNRSEAIRLLVDRGLAFYDISDVVELIIEHSLNYVRGAKLSRSDELAYLEALATLTGTIDQAEEDKLRLLSSIQSARSR